MASLTTQANGRRMIQFVGSDHQRRTIRLGKMDARMAEKVRVMVEELVASAISGFAVREEVARWLAGLDDVLRDRLAAVGLIEQQEAALLGPFIDAYVAGRNDVKPRT